MAKKQQTEQSLLDEKALVEEAIEQTQDNCHSGSPCHSEQSEETLDEEISQDDKDNAQDEAVLKLSNTHFIDIACFEYIGEKNYNYKDRNNISYHLVKNQLVLVPKGNISSYFSYKKTLFKRVF